MRTKPGPMFWGWIYTIMGAFQIAMPGWAATSATALGAWVLGRLPAEGDADLVLYLGYAILGITILLLLVGRKIERTLEYIEWFMVISIFSYLLFVDIFLVSGETWAKVVPGFFAFGSMPPGADWLLLAHSPHTPVPVAASTASSPTGTEIRASAWVPPSASSPAPSAASRPP